ncbi:hypothetical protein D3C73_1463500 [compost metagenome]
MQPLPMKPASRATISTTLSWPGCMSSGAKIRSGGVERAVLVLMGVVAHAETAMVMPIARKIFFIIPP